MSDPDQSEWVIAARAAMARFDAKGFTADEAIFEVRGRDELGADTVKHWAAKGYIARVNPDKLIEALEIADRMAAFPGRRLPD